MKTKPFLLATAGSTVDGRTIDAKMLQEMASSYDPKTYGARLNIEHIRGVSGQSPFNAYGDVIELSTGEIEVDFNGTKEKRVALYGVLDINDQAKQLNEAGQKLYPSIEIEPNFAGKGFAYLMGCALTDSPASIATERLQFNRSLPGSLTLTGDAAQSLEFEEDKQAAGAAEEVKGFFAKLTEMLGVSTSAPAPAPAPASEPAPAAAFDPAKFAADLGETLQKAFAIQSNDIDSRMADLTAKFAKLEETVNGTAAPGHVHRPAANGPNGDFTKTDC